MTLTEFLLERITEDEGYANYASAGRWKMWGMTVMADTFGDSNVDHCAEVARTIFVDDHGKPRTWNGLHITRWEPARVLAECEAKRRILQEWQRSEDENRRAYGVNPAPSIIARALALPYADHPDFDPAWRP